MMAENRKVHYEPMEVQVISDDECDIGPEKNYVEVEKTLDYIHGNMTFEEYSAILEQGIKEEPVDESEEIPSDIAQKFDNSLSNVLPTLESSSLTCVEVMRSMKRRGPRSRRKLPKTIAGLVGEANSKFASGDLNDAQAMCFEVIRNAPNFPQPFQTLAMIWEERGDMEKSLEYMLIAAHLMKTDIEEWKRVGDIHLEQDNLAQAIGCYERASRLDPANIVNCQLLCALLKRLGDRRRILETYGRLLAALPIAAVGEYMRITRKVVKGWHKLGEKMKALNIMSDAFRIHPSAIEVIDINTLLELYISFSMFDKPVEVLVRHCAVQLHYCPTLTIEASNLSTGWFLPKQKPIQCTVPSEMQIDLRSKLIVCLIHLGFYECIDNVFAPMRDGENIEAVGDLFLDIADAYVSCGLYAPVKPILANLIITETYNMAAVWLRYAECLNALQELRNAAAAYVRVLEMAPNHYQARLSLSAIYQQLGQSDDALQILSISDERSEAENVKGAPALPVGSEESDIRLLIARCSLLHSQSKHREFVDCAKRVLFSFCREIVDNDKFKGAIIDYRKMRNRLLALRYAIGMNFDEKVRSAGLRISQSCITTEDLWALYLRLCTSLIGLRSFEEFENVSVLALICPQFMNNPVLSAEADFVCLSACVMNRNGNFAYSLIREICVKNLQSIRAWNTFGMIVTLSQDLRHNRFCLRLAMKYPSNLALSVLNGNNAMVAGSYKHALGEYVAALRHNPNDPLINLLIGLCFVHMGSQKFVQKRHSLMIQSCAFLNQYFDLRGECQESYYNVGRAFHQLGLSHIAAHYYEQGLNCSPLIPDNPQYDLTRELAFNLCLIYKSSKSYGLARHVMHRYLII